MTHNYKHSHGTKNIRIAQEESRILSAVDMGRYSSNNSQTIGRNGEIPFLDFLNRYLPPAFRAVSGHFITPSGKISPQIDVMILDSRYPLISQNADNSVLAMLHSVIETIEIKTNLTSRDIKSISESVFKMSTLFEELDIYDDDIEEVGYGPPRSNAIAYRTKVKLDTIEDHFQRTCDPLFSYYDLYILRILQSDIDPDEDVGCFLHYEPASEVGGDFYFTNLPKYTPLSDYYYRLVQDGYYTLGARDFSFSDIGEHIMDYMSWSTASWEDVCFGD